jgi:hypothetical protein
MCGDGIPFTKTTARNIALFREERGLDQYPLPNTITDSMKLVSLLGERYLWVDAVCIVQDDENAKAKQMAKTDLVYAGALLTIVAASGDTAAPGLPGVREGTRSVVQGTMKINKNLFLMQIVIQGRPDRLESSAWHSRGWTLQERLLSRRILSSSHPVRYFGGLRLRCGTRRKSWSL